MDNQSPIIPAQLQEYVLMGREKRWASMIKKLSPSETYILFKRDIVNREEIVKAAESWIGNRWETMDVLILAGLDKEDTWEIERLFEKIVDEKTKRLAENKYQLALNAVKIMLEKIASSEIRPFEGAEVVVEQQHNVDYSKYENERAFRYFCAKKKYAGQELGIQKIVGGYWELNDILDGSWKPENPYKDIGELQFAIKEEAEKLLTLIVKNKLHEPDPY